VFNKRGRIRHSTNGKVDPSSLGSLYPEAKTFAQRALEDKQREERYISRQPRFVRYKTALYASFVFGITIIYVVGVQYLWRTGSIIGIFFSFAIALAIVAALFSYGKYVESTFYSFNRSVSLYVLFEFILISAALFLFIFIQTKYPNQLFISAGVTALAHFIALYGILLVLIRYGRS
jgi:hypothetical protein